MARVGETDQRWIVSKRSDGKNVGNWHWSEKNLWSWGEARVKELFKSLPVPSTQCSELLIQRVESISGEMSILNRKGKLINIYDFTFNLEWSAEVKVAGEVEKVEGEVKVTDVVTDDTPTLRVKCKKSSAASEIAKGEMEKIGKPLILEKIEQVLAEMTAKQDGLVHNETEAEVITDSKPVLIAKGSPQTDRQEKPSASDATSSPGAGKQVGTKSFKQIIVFNADPVEIFETLVDSNRLSAFTGAPAVMSRKPGEPFSLYGGSVEGVLLEIEPPNKIVQKWRNKSWPEGHYSTVTFSIVPNAGRSEITLTQTGIPSSDYDRTREGWEAFYWSRIRGLFSWPYKITL